MSLRKILYGLEYVFDGLLCDHLVIDFKRMSATGPLFTAYLRWWHPSTWIGYVRCVWLGDKCGSAYYGTPTSSTAAQAAETEETLDKT